MGSPLTGRIEKRCVIVLIEMEMRAEVEVEGIVKTLHRIGDGEIGEMMVVLPIGLDMISALKICSSFLFLLSTSFVLPFWSLFLSHLF